MGAPASDCIFCRKSIPYFQQGDKRWTKRIPWICQKIDIITKFLTDPAWEVYILEELCYTKTTIGASDGELGADVPDRVAGSGLWQGALRCVWYCAGSDRTKGAYRKKEDVQGERISRIPRRGRAGAEGTSVCFPCTGTVFRHASRDTTGFQYGIDGNDILKEKELLWLKN